jgi:hypothetical protein
MSLFSSLYRLWFHICDTPRQIKWFCQRGKRGYADCDLWNLGPYTITTLLAALKEFKKVFNEKEYKCVPGDESEETWNEKLQVMIDGLMEAEKICEHDWFISSDSREEMLKKHQAAKLKADQAFDTLKDSIYGLCD